MSCGPSDMVQHLPQRDQMALPGHIQTLATGLPSRQLQQHFAQQIQAFSRLCGQGHCQFLGQARRRVDGVQLVPDVQHGRASRCPFDQQSGQPAVLRHGVAALQRRATLQASWRDLCEVVQQEDGVSFGNFGPCARDADTFNLVIAVAQAGGVDHVHRHALDLNGLLHLVPGCAGKWRHDRQLGPSQRIE